MAKEKVYKLAQEFKVSSEALVQILHGMGIPVKSHMSTVDENLRDEIKKRFEQERAEIKREYDRKKQILTKAREELFSKTEEPAVPASAPSAVAEKAEARPAGRELPTRAQTSVRHAEPSRRTFERDPRRDTYMPSAVATPRFAVPGAPVPAGGGAGGAQGRRDRGRKKGGKKRIERPEINEFELKANVKKTLAKIGSGSARKKYKKEEGQKETGVRGRAENA